LGVRNYLFWLAISVVIGLIFFQTSANFGRLSHSVSYDDIAYVNDASDRLSVFHSDGVATFLSSFSTNAPHSPFTAVLALISLLVFGFQDAGFYLTNILVVSAATVFLWAQFRQVRTAELIWVCSFFLLSPLAYATIENFKPDLALGLVTAGVIWFCLKGALGANRKNYIWAGLCFGGALLVKPSFFAHTTAMAIGVLILAVGISLARSRLIGSRTTVLDPLVRFFLLGIAIATPYYLASAKQIFEYFWINTQGRDAHLWSFPSTDGLLDVAVNFINQGYLQNGGYHLHWAWLLIIIALMITAVQRRWEAFAFVFFLACSGAASFMILVVGRHMNHHFFASYIALIFLAGLAGACAITERSRGLGRGILLCTLFLGTALVVVNGQRFYTTPQTTEDIKPGDVNELLAQAIAREAKALGTGTAPADAIGVFVTVAGPVNAHSIKWEARKKGVYLTALDRSRWADWELYQSALTQASFVVVPASVRAEFFQKFPSTTLQRDLLVQMMEDPQFRRVDYGNFEPYGLFSRVGQHSDEVFTVDEPSMLEGFAQAVGPYPVWGLPKLRWMTGNGAKLCAFTPGQYDFKFSGRYANDGVGLVVTQDGADLHVTADFNDKELRSFSFTAEIRSDAPCLIFSADAPSAPPQGYVLFTSGIGKRVGN
jgi:hypothetical protein